MTVAVLVGIVVGLVVAYQALDWVTVEEHHEDQAEGEEDH